MQSVINFIYDSSFCDTFLSPDKLPRTWLAPLLLSTNICPILTCVHVNTCVHSPVYTCTLPSSTDWIWQSAEWCCHERTLCSLCCQPSAANCPAELRSHSAADVTQFITTQPAAAVRSYPVNSERLFQIVSVLLCSRCSQLNVGACGAMGLVRDFHCGLLQ